MEQVMDNIAYLKRRIAELDAELEAEHRVHEALTKMLIEREGSHGD